jgi:hypothetical protein
MKRYLFYCVYKMHVSTSNWEVEVRYNLEATSMTSKVFVLKEENALLSRRYNEESESTLAYRHLIISL